VNEGRGQLAREESESKKGFHAFGGGSRQLCVGSADIGSDVGVWGGGIGDEKEVPAERLRKKEYS